MGEIVTDIFTVDNVVAITFLVYMVTTWYLRREASGREHELDVLRVKLSHERVVSRDKQAYDTQSEMIELLRACQENGYKEEAVDTGGNEG